LEARVLKSTGSWYIIETSEGEVQGARLRGRLRQLEKKLTNPIAAGDRVVLSTEKDDILIRKVDYPPKVDKKRYEAFQLDASSSHTRCIARYLGKAKRKVRMKQQEGGCELPYDFPQNGIIK